MAKVTLEQLWLSATRLSPWRRNYSQSPKRQINQIVPFLGTRTVLFTGSFWGLTENSVHLSNILFMDCEIIEEVVRPQQQAPVTPTVATPQQPNTPQQGTAVNKPVGTSNYGGVVNAEPNYSTSTHFKVTYAGKNYWIKKIDMKRQACLVRCSCSDYYFTWSWANYNNGVQFGGRARPYHRKTKDRKPRNPANIMGLCKHISQFAQMLQTSGYAL